MTTGAVIASDISTTTSAVAFSTRSAPASVSAIETSERGNATATFRATQTATPGLQGSGSGSGVTSAGTGLRDEDWARGMVVKALLTIGGAEVVWEWFRV